MIHPNTTIGAITLKVADLDNMVPFYRDVMGLQVLETSQSDDLHKTVTLGTAKRPLIHLRHLPGGRRVQRQSGLFHLALRVPHRTASANWLRHFASLNAPNWQGASNHGPSRSLYMADPEGNGLEVTYDLPRDQWPVDANGKFMVMTEQFDVQALMADAETDTFTGIDPETVMGHIHLSVNEIPSAKRFYVDLLDFEIQVEMPNSALFVSTNGYHHNVALNVWQSQGGPLNSAEYLGLDSYEITFDSAESRQQTLDRLTENGNTFETLDDVPTVIDPFNNRIAFTIQNS
ncbi:MAG: VOC family protein [Anaerolineae bacterium]